MSLVGNLTGLVEIPGSLGVWGGGGQTYKQI